MKGDCEGCNEEATIFLTQIVNGKIKKVNLCASCPKKAAVEDPTGFALADTLLGLGASEEMRQQGDTLACPQCGFTHKDFKKTGRLGCSECYATFADALAPILESMHKGTSHSGKIPERALRLKEVSDRLVGLRAELDEAVVAEEFEKAADLRDQIRKLEQQGFLE